VKKSFFSNLIVCLLLLLSLNIVFSSFVNADEESLPDISSPSALLMDYSSGKILYEKNINEKRYPASLTKIMTAIIVLENCELSDIATVSYDAVMSLSSGYVTANLQVGEELTVEQLLYVLMVGSSNDAAIVLAEHVSGSVENFATLMNEKAKELGCTSTNFVNPNGVHDENHYSTAYDLALIAKYAMQNDTFRALVSTTSYTLPSTNKYDREDRIFRTTNSLLQLDISDRADNYYYKYATGIKTGFTTPAGNCLIASANKNNLELITVVLGAGQTKDGLSQRYLDTLSLFDYGYNTYTLKEIINSGRVVQTLNVKNATKNTKKLDAVVENDIYALMKQSNKDSTVLPEIKLNDNLKAPIKKGDIIGSVTYTVEGIEYTENLLANSDVKKSRFLLKLIIFVIIILLFWIYIKNKKIKNKKQRLKNKYK
jgi:serine-type D-Ala-D-Ala carboxypeptidase (penicillin-binding protein 5/6)